MTCTLLKEIGWNGAPVSRPAVVRASSPALVQEQLQIIQPEHYSVFHQSALCQGTTSPGSPAIGLRRWGGYRGPHRLGVPGERFLLAGVKGQVFVDGVETGVPIDSGSPASDFCSLG